MISANQMKAARALADLDQLALAELSGVSIATIRRMEGSKGTVRANVDSLVKIIQAFDEAGVDLIGEGESSEDGGRGVRLKQKTLENFP